MRRSLGVLLAATAAVAVACRPIPTPLPRGARPAMIIEVRSDAATAAVLRTAGSGFAPSRPVATDLVAATPTAWTSWDVDDNGSGDLVRLRPDGATLRLEAAQVWPPTGGLVLDTPTALEAAPPGVRRFAAIDADGDGRTDVAEVRAPAGGGALELRVAPAASGYATAEGPTALPAAVTGDEWWVAALDADRDCRADLVVAAVSDDGIDITVLGGARGFADVVARSRWPLPHADAVTTVLSTDDDLGGPPVLWAIRGGGRPDVTARAVSDPSGTTGLTLPLAGLADGATLVAPANPPTAGPVESIPVAGRAEQVDVGGGIVVHRCIAGQVRGLLDAARRAGFPFSGAGWRSSAEQAVLRRRSCGARWATAPTEACRPPTAPVALSMHERGLAIDLRLGGRAITSRRSAAFTWLAANAGRFGLRNYEPEPWHWSTNGE